jgi:pimeloyl-ACP methyl ester carboxylesterase
MPYVNNNGVKIYYEVKGDGNPLVFAHGFSMSHIDWRENRYVTKWA